MRYYKVQIGYGDDFISIDETELEKALYAQMTGGTVFLNEGSVTGNSIISIRPDFHKAMGWNYGYKFTPEDHAEINRECGHYKGYLAEVKDKVSYLMKTNQSKLIGQNIELSALPDYQPKLLK
jgi:hypothetical protein